MMKKILLMSVILFSLIIPVGTLADNSVCAYYFYGDGCHYCAQIAEYLDQVEQDYPDLELDKFEVWYDSENNKLLQDYFNAYNVPEGPGQRGVPALFIGDSYLIGLGPIVQNLTAEIEKQPTDCPSLEDVNGQGGVGQISIETFSLGSIAIIIGAALVDSINPCAIAVILILLTSLLVIGKRKAMLAGLMFTLSVYIVYFLFGLGMFAALQSILLPITFVGNIFRYIVAAVAMIIGILNLKDFVWYGGGGFVMEIPRSWRPRMTKLIKSAVSPIGAFALRFVQRYLRFACGRSA